MKLNGLGRNSKSFTEHKFSYYNFGFITKINNATEKDIELSEHYGVELVSSFHKVMIPLIFLEKGKESSSVTSTDTEYYVHIGKMIFGKLTISIQRYLQGNKVVYIYKYKDRYKRPKSGSHLGKRVVNRNRENNRRSIKEFKEK